MNAGAYWRRSPWVAGIALIMGGLVVLYLRGLFAYRWPNAQFPWADAFKALFIVSGGSVLYAVLPLLMRDQYRLTDAGLIRNGNLRRWADIRGFAVSAHPALPGIRVVLLYSHTFPDPSIVFVDTALADGIVEYFRRRVPELNPAQEAATGPVERGGLIAVGVVSFLCWFFLIFGFTLLTLVLEYFGLTRDGDAASVGAYVAWGIYASAALTGLAFLLRRFRCLRGGRRIVRIVLGASMSGLLCGMLWLPWFFILLRRISSRP